MLDSNEFDSWAADYEKEVIESDRCGTFPFSGYHNCLDKIYKIIMSHYPANVLDLGVGTGTFAKMIYDGGNIVTGIDFSSKMLMHARTRIPEALFIEWDFANGLPPLLNDKKFDFIISTYALHHLTDELKMALLRNLKPYLNENGMILIGDIMFATEEARDVCRKSNYESWDDDEYPLAYELIEKELKNDWSTQFMMVSQCAGILKLSNVK